ncbi:protein DMR6-LIKE OXYGENASE 1 [Cryptomeria japonica]|uniref:protein DMR6-LIKE OXYGENASE 1 n=1 Tax=Cryptomeria japonica TaxID=3369 RepID=UPI0027DA5D1F|nr:protein DMR6-LIKE OXYGENASE 1 [Cryptomeria japonica]
MTSSAHVNFNAVEKLMSNGHNHLHAQNKIVLPPGERPDMSKVCHSYKFPVIDLKDLDGPQRINVVNDIRRACDEDGFFQIINHGVPETVMKSMMDIAREFFEMPVEERVCLYSEDPRQARGCREVLQGDKNTSLKLLAAISKALGQDSDYLNEIFGKPSQVLRINYYPACPNPDVTFGMVPHSDPGGITVLMQGDVSGLQVLKDGKWFAVKPTPNAFVADVADQIEVVSNGRFKSAEHGAVTNTTTAHISIPTFYGPSSDTFVAPAASMVDEERPALYRSYKFEEYMAAFWSQCGLKGKRILDRFKIEISP